MFVSGLLTPALWRKVVFDHLTFLILLFFCAASRHCCIFTSFDSVSSLSFFSSLIINNNFYLIDIFASWSLCLQPEHFEQAMAYDKVTSSSRSHTNMYVNPWKVIHEQVQVHEHTSL